MLNIATSDPVSAPSIAPLALTDTALSEGGVTPAAMTLRKRLVTPVAGSTTRIAAEPPMSRSASLAVVGVPPSKTHQGEAAAFSGVAHARAQGRLPGQMQAPFVALRGALRRDAIVRNEHAGPRVH